MSAKFSRRCAHPSCTTHASYGVKYTKKVEFCARHAHDRMVNAVSKRCGHGSCSKLANYGFESRRIKEFCSPHAEEGMTLHMT